LFGILAFEHWPNVADSRGLRQPLCRRSPLVIASQRVRPEVGGTPSRWRDGDPVPAR
jgi:hypothetical protein